MRRYGKRFVPSFNVDDFMLKFAKKDNQSELLEKLITDEDQRRSAASVNSTFDPIHITECPRRILYRSTGTGHNLHLTYLQRLSKEACKDKWISLFDKSLKVKLVDQDIVVADSKYNITGKVDAIISFGDDIFATKIKSVCEESFINIQETGALKKDVVELILDLWLLEIRDGLIIYDNNNGGYVTFHVEPYEPIIKTIKRKCGELMRQSISGDLPDRPYDDSSSGECHICEFNQKCWSTK